MLSMVIFLICAYSASFIPCISFSCYFCCSRRQTYATPLEALATADANTYCSSGSFNTRTGSAQHFVASDMSIGYITNIMFGSADLVGSCGLTWIGNYVSSYNAATGTCSSGCGSYQNAMNAASHNIGCDLVGMQRVHIVLMVRSMFGRQ
jgi:hypothetical protein